VYTITLKLQDGQNELKHDLKDGQCLVVGRTKLSDFAIEDDHAISSRHLRICDAGGLQIEDLGSTNGTWLESEKLVPGQQYPLPLHQEVQLGTSLLTVTPTLSLDQTRVGAPTFKPKFVGVLYTDIVQSTVMTRRLGDERAMEMLAWHNQMFRERFRKFNAIGKRESKFTGDGFEAVFNSVNDALACAASCQRALARRNHDDSTGFHLDVRMGINGGEAPSSGQRVYGMPLILAARVMSEAVAAQVLVPAHVMGIVAGSLWRFTPVGDRRLKGLEEPMPLFEVNWRADPNLMGGLDLLAHASDNGQNAGTPPRGGRGRATEAIQ
jgi:class 3 adenylate cyclase